jgi:hypothetical protein
MKVSNIILLVGSIIVVVFAYKWYASNDSTYESLVTFSSSILTAIAYYFSLQKEKNEKSKPNSSTKIKGDDNIVIKNSDNNRINIKFRRNRFNNYYKSQRHNCDKQIYDRYEC